MNNDQSRCAASNCPIAEQCQRHYLQHIESLKEDGWYCDFSVAGEECGFFIAVDKGEE